MDREHHRRRERLLLLNPTLRTGFTMTIDDILLSLKAAASTSTVDAPASRASRTRSARASSARFSTDFKESLRCATARTVVAADTRSAEPIRRNGTLIRCTHFIFDMPKAGNTN